MQKPAPPATLVQLPPPKAQLVRVPEWHLGTSRLLRLSDVESIEVRGVLKGRLSDVAWLPPKRQRDRRHLDRWPDAVGLYNRAGDRFADFGRFCNVGGVALQLMHLRHLMAITETVLIGGA